MKIMTAIAWGALMSAGFADASAQSCSVPVLKVLAQKSLGLTVMEKTLAEYEKKNGTKVQISSPTTTTSCRAAAPSPRTRAWRISPP